MGNVEQPKVGCFAFYLSQLETLTHGFPEREPIMVHQNQNKLRIFS